MIMLEKRPQPSRAWTFATPLLAVVLTMFAAMAFDPRLIWDKLEQSHDRPH